MLKRVLIFSLLISPLMIQTAQAGLIDYDRKKRRQQKSNVAAPTSGRATVPTKPAAAKPAAIVAKEPIKIQNNSERVYDANKDGFLQEAERQRFLKDVLATIGEIGEFKVNSDVVQAFDANKDGEISLNEAQAIQRSLN